MNDPIREVLQGVSDIIECTYAHDDYGRVDGPGHYSDTDIVESLCCLEEDVWKALDILDTQNPAVQDLPKSTLETIVSVLVARFDCTEHGVSWDHRSVANCVHRLLQSRGLLGR